MAGQVTALAGCRDGTTGSVSHDDHQRRLQMLDGIFYGAKDLLVHYIACIADDEEVTKLLVEDNLGCHTAVGTAQHYCEWMLTRGELLPQCCIVVFWCQSSRDEAIITLFE